LADQRITQLTALPKAGVAATDVLPIADISASETKKVTAKDLVAAGIDLVDNGEIDLAKLDQASLTKLGTEALADGAVTYAKLQDVSATDRLLGRRTAGAGDVEEIGCTAAGRALLDDVDAAAQRTTLGLGTLATQSGTFSGTHSGTTSGTNTGDQTITLTGAVTGSGTGSFATSITNNAVTYGKIQNTTTANVVLGRSSAGGGTVEEIACTSVGRAVIGSATAADQRTALGLGSIATQSAGAVAITGGSLSAVSITSASTTITGGSITGITDLAVADGGTGASNAADARTNLGVTIGTNVQAYDAGLQSIAALTTGANQTIYTTGADTYAVTGLTAAGRALLDDADAAAQRTTLGLGTVATVNSVGTSELTDDAVTAAKLANESTVDFVTSLPASGAYNGQLALTTGDNKVYSWSGATWTPIKAAGSLNTLVGGTAGVVNVTVSATGDTATINTTLDNTASAAQFLAGPTAASGVVTYRTIAGDDLPTATTTTKGAVVVNGNGLTISGNTIAINNTVTAETSNHHVVQYNSRGLVTGGRTLVGADVPVATVSTVGVISPGSGLGVTGLGTLNHTNAVVGGTAAKVTYDNQGHITSALSLNSTDIPDLDASKITSGTFSTARLAPNSVTAAQLADYGIAQVSSSQPVPEFAGQLWINPTDRTAYVWVGQVSPAQGYYLPLNNEFGAQANLRFGGTYNASTNTVSSLNTYGAGAGLTVGSSLIAPTSASAGVYLLVTTAGTGVAPAPAVALDVGDWILSPGQGTTWTHVNLVGAGISVIDAGDVTFSGGSLTPAMTGVADAEAALTTLWGRVQIATASTLGIVLETTEIEVNNSTGAMTVGTVDEGTY
jgi:hypothetical protein